MFDVIGEENEVDVSSFGSVKNPWILRRFGIQRAKASGEPSM